MLLSDKQLLQLLSCFTTCLWWKCIGLLSCSTTCLWRKCIGHRNTWAKRKGIDTICLYWLKEQKIRHQIPQELFDFTRFTDGLRAANLLFRNQFLQLGLKILHLQKHNQHPIQSTQNSTSKTGRRTVLRDRTRSASAAISHHPAWWPPAPGNTNSTGKKFSARQPPQPVKQHTQKDKAPPINGPLTMRDRSLETAVRPRKNAMAGALGYDRTWADTATKQTDDLIRLPQPNSTETPKGQRK
jgi:hypothetical protein